MTFRLVALMTGVLLVTLAAFGLLIGQYQEQVLKQVADTASEVGRATLRTIEVRSDDPSVRALDEGFVVWKDEAGETTTVEGVGTMIDVDEVRAESDAARGLVLRIPRLKPTDAGAAGDVSVSVTRVSDGGTESGFMARREEVVLPVSTGAFGELFAALRGRSLLIFVAVFLVGAVLTAGLAARFTRPIRRLDAGIRRLSAGDLDVQVDVAGRDEIARLAAGFNEMARSLRTHRERSRELARREKLSALGRLAAGVAHDVRNPLHSITLALDELGETSRPAESGRAVEFERSLDVIRGEIRRLDELIGNFLRFARSERRPREPVPLAALVADTLRLVEAEAGRRGVTIDAALDETSATTIDGDAESLRAAVLNIVLNAFEAMPDGGTLDVSLRGEPGSAVLEIADSGEGIPAEDRERVFEFAYTTRDGGNGLGLAMVHHCVVEEHGGRVELDSEPGRGTRVRLALPAENIDRAAS